LTCRTLVTHVEPDVGGTSVYALVGAKGQCSEVRAPKILRDVVSRAKTYKIQVIKKIKNAPKKVTYEDGYLKFLCEKECSFVVKAWALTGVPVTPFVTDVDIVTNMKNVFTFNIKATKVRERGGVLGLQNLGSAVAIDVRTFDPLSNFKALLVEPLSAPRRSFYAYFPDGSLYLVGPDVKERIAVVRDLMDVVSFPYGYLTSIIRKDKVDVISKRKGTWTILKRVEGAAKSAEWCLVDSTPALAIYYEDHISLVTLREEIINIAVEGWRAASLSPNAELLLLSTGEGVKLIDLNSGEKLKEFKLKGVELISWSPYSDFAALCSKEACWIYSNLSKEIATVRKVSNATSVWWSPSTYNLYVARGNKLEITFFDPPGVKATLLVARRPILRETSRERT